MSWIATFAAPLSLSPLLKIPLVAANASYMHIAYTPPNAMPDRGDMQKYGTRSPPTFIYKLRRDAAVVAKSINWLLALYESALALLQSSLLPWTGPDQLLASLTPLPDPTPAIHTTPAWLLGSALIISGASIRIACQRELGPFFTWEKSVKKDQRLVTTGPYAIVRHPSYTGMILATVGTLLCQLGPGSWFMRSGWSEVGPLKAVAIVWLGYTVALPCVLSARTSSEDRALRGHFPEEWDVYAKRTRYRLIPYVF